MSKQPPTCLDCYFHRHGLCALVADKPCPTFRAAGQLLLPPPQPQLVPRTLAAATTSAAYG
ncbi:MAG TPA: hypothetical protein VG265_02355 [Gaiellaceae bacterium]|nr:hypothetical protein [Gaiellaceae bacterium]